LIGAEKFAIRDYKYATNLGGKPHIAAAGSAGPTNLGVSKAASESLVLSPLTSFQISNCFESLTKVLSKVIYKYGLLFALKYLIRQYNLSVVLVKYHIEDSYSDFRNG